MPKFDDTVTITLEVFDAEDRLISTRYVDVRDTPDRAWADIVTDACDQLAARLEREDGIAVTVMPR